MQLTLLSLTLTLILLGLPAFAAHTRRALSSPHRLQSNLFPPKFNYTSGFTTASNVFVPGVDRTALSDASLNVVKANLQHPIVTQSGKTAWQAYYPEGSYKPSAYPKGGFGLYVQGADSFKQAVADGAEEVLLAYSMMFEPGFQFNKGGKLPGGFGGVGDLSFSCSGGRQKDREDCFGLRMMWRRDGQGELYTYLPLTDKNSVALLATPPLSVANTDFGFSIGRGSCKFPTGEWITVAERIKLNDVGKQNGEVEVWINGRSVIRSTGLALRTSGDSLIQGLQFQTFFGGSDASWASPRNQKTWFADVSGAVIQ